MISDEKCTVFLFCSLAGKVLPMTTPHSGFIQDFLFVFGFLLFYFDLPECIFLVFIPFEFYL